MRNSENRDKSRLYASTVFRANPFSTAIIERKVSICGLRASFMLRRQALIEHIFDLFEPVRVHHLDAALVRDVKNIRHLIDVGGNLRDMDRQAELVQLVSDVEQHADPIIGENFDNIKLF